MSHQPFESWLLSNDQLDAQQQETLNNHLDKCEDCKDLSTALYQVTAMIDSSPAPTPAPGFTQRWHNRLAVYRQQRQQRRMWVFTLGLFAIAGLLFITLAFININTINWTYQLGRTIANVSSAANLLQRSWRALIALTNAFPIMIPIMAIFGSGSLLAMIALVITWFTSIIKIYQPAPEGAN